MQGRGRAQGSLGVEGRRLAEARREVEVEVEVEERREAQGSSDLLLLAGSKVAGMVH